VKVLLVDDHVLFREGLKFLLRALDPGLEPDEAGNCAEALERAAERDYDLVLLDLKLPGRHGLDALEALREAIPGVPLVVLSGEDDPRTIRMAIERGAMGFIPKSSTSDVLVKALQLVLAQGVYLPPAALDTDYSLAASSTPTSLRSGSGDTALEAITPRQMEVLRCVIQGKPNKVIARELGIASGTVKQHVSGVLRSLGAQNRTEAVYAAAKLGLRLA
jgi:DNA-binding NarL/FixJ family response regulator